MAGAAELLARGQPRWSCTDDGHALSGAQLRRFWPDPALLKCPFDDCFFNLLDRHGRLVDAQYAGSFARGGADAPGKFGKVVGRVQHADGFAPAIAVDQVVPVWDDIADWTAGVAERYTAIHAARTLGADLVLGEIKIDLEPVVDPLGDGTPLRHFPRVFHETGVFTHDEEPLGRWFALEVRP